MSYLSQFEKQQYLNLETLRKNGNAIKTPVWFVQDGDNLIVWTEVSAGKAKRIRNTAAVRINPCKSDGTVLGEWVPATARVDDSSQALEHLKGLMSKKYGFAFAAFGLMGKLRRSTYTSIHIQLS